MKINKCADSIEEILRKAKEIKDPDERKKLLPKWSDVNRLNAAVNSLRELLE